MTFLDYCMGTVMVVGFCLALYLVISGVKVR